MGTETLKTCSNKKQREGWVMLRKITEVLCGTQGRYLEWIRPRGCVQYNKDDAHFLFGREREMLANPDHLIHEKTRARIYEKENFSDLSCNLNERHHFTQSGRFQWPLTSACTLHGERAKSRSRREKSNGGR